MKNQEKIYEYLGGKDNIEKIQEAIKSGKKIIFKQTSESILIPSYSIQADSILSLITLGLTITIPSYGNGKYSKKVNIKKSGTGIEIESFNYLEGKIISNGIQNLTTGSTDADIKSVFPVQSLEELYMLSKMGCKFRVNCIGLLLNSSVFPVITVIKQDSDFSIFITGTVPFFFNDGSEIRGISYSASSNTYEVQL